jgi:hypothetical protein
MGNTMTNVRCDLPPDQRDFRPDPFPGSEDAFRSGCTCPQNQPLLGGFLFDINCPVHELEKVAS